MPFTPLYNPNDSSVTSSSGFTPLGSASDFRNQTEEPEKKKRGIFSRVYEDMSDRFGRIKTRTGEALGGIREAGEREVAGQQTWLDTAWQSMGEVAGLGTYLTGEALGAGMKGAAQVSAAVRSGPEKTMDEQYEEDIQAFKDLASFALKTGTGKKAIKTVEDLSNQWNQFEEDKPRAAANILATGRMVDFVTLFSGTGLAKKGTSELAKQVTKRITNVAKDLARIKFPNLKGSLPSMGAAGDIATGVGERFGRAGQRVSEAMEKSRALREKVRQATPEIGEALKTGLDERYIQMVEMVDDKTRNAFREMLDVAEEIAPLGQKTQPEIVAGRAAENIFDVLEAERKQIGSKIGEAASKLDSEYISMTKARDEMQEALSLAGIKLKDGALDFSGSSFTKAQRTKINELYDLATENLSKMTPQQVYKKDQLFSQLQREARMMDKVGDVLVDLPNGNKKSLFNVFRDIYSKQLDELSPEMRSLNRKYARSRTLLNDIENRIFRAAKSESIDVIEAADIAEFAKLNLKKMLGESQNSETIRNIITQAYKRAGELGYDGPDPRQLISFAIGLRDLYPNIVKSMPGGFTGSIATGIKAGLGRPSGLFEAASSVYKMGEPTLKDQQAALRKVIESLLNKADDTVPKVKGVAPSSAVKEVDET